MSIQTRQFYLHHLKIKNIFVKKKKPNGTVPFDRIKGQFNRDKVK